MKFLTSIVLFLGIISCASSESKPVVNFCRFDGKMLESYFDSISRDSVIHLSCEVPDFLDSETVTLSFYFATSKTINSGYYTFLRKGIQLHKGINNFEVPFLDSIVFDQSTSPDYPGEDFTIPEPTIDPNKLFLNIKTKQDTFKICTIAIYSESFVPIKTGRDTIADGCISYSQWLHGKKMFDIRSSTAYFIKCNSKEKVDMPQKLLDRISLYLRNDNQVTGPDTINYQRTLK